MGNGTKMDLLCTAITDIRSLIQSAEMLLFKVFACLVTGLAGSSLTPTKNEFATGIGLFTMVTMGTEIFGIIKRTFMIPARKPVGFYLF